MKLTLDSIADFTWGFGSTFFLETEHGNYVWSDPEYNGDNTIVKFNGSCKDWCESEGIDYGRGKGKHYIENYCGKNVIIKED